MQLAGPDLMRIVSHAGAGKEARVVPADVLLLAGSCIVEEAVLTGESTPQWKTPIGTHSAKGAASEGADVAQVCSWPDQASSHPGVNDTSAVPHGDFSTRKHEGPNCFIKVHLDTHVVWSLSDVLLLHLAHADLCVMLQVDPKERLNIKRDRNFVLFSGTKVLQHTEDRNASIRTPDGGCLAVVLRTGFETSQGAPSICMKPDRCSADRSFMDGRATKLPACPSSSLQLAMSHAGT